MATSIEASELHAVGDEAGRLPLDALTEENDHVHGALRWVVDGREVPGLSPLPGEACLDEWWDAFADAVEMLAEGDGALVVDAGEEGAPGYIFERSGPSLLISVVDGIGGGRVDPAWQKVPVPWPEFVASVRALQTGIAGQLAGVQASLPTAWRERLEAASR